MSNVIHYEDDIFIVDGLARVLADAARLEPDPDVVGDAVLSAARAADSSFRRVRDLVLEKEHLVDRAEYLRLLARTARTLSDAVAALARSDSPLSAVASSSADELSRMAQAHRAALSELRDALHSVMADDGSAEELVSGDELSELLRSENGKA